MMPGVPVLSQLLCGRTKDVPRGTLRAIINQAGLTVEEFLALL